MAHSSLATYIRYSPFCSKPRNHSIDSIAIHCMSGNLTVETCGELFNTPGQDASSNYGIGSDGRIAVYVEEENRSWCTSNRAVDNRAITIEVASTTDSEPYECTNEAYESLIRLLVDVCQRNNIYELKWKNDMHYALAAANGGPVREQNMFVHRWFNLDKSCPGQYLFMRQGQIAKEVNARLKGDKETAMQLAAMRGSTYTTPMYNATTGNYITMDTINYREYNPYLVTLTRNSNIKYDAFKGSGVIGAMVEAGYYFESNRRKAYKFDNQNLSAQIKNLDKVELPYGLFTYARARTSKEAKEEMYWFSFPVRRYTPTLGVWLQLELGKDKNSNKFVIERYRDDLWRLGFKGKIGLIATPYQLSLIDWDSYKDDFFLWSIDHISDLDDLNQLLDPSFFDMDEKLDYYTSGNSVVAKQ